MANPTGAAKETMGFLADEFPALSNSARTFVRDHPREARLAVAAALEAVAAQRETEDADADAQVPEGLRPFLVRRGAGEDILGVSEAAKRLEVSRTTVYDWVDRKMRGRPSAGSAFPRRRSSVPEGWSRAFRMSSTPSGIPSWPGRFSARSGHSTTPWRRL